MTSAPVLGASSIISTISPHTPIDTGRRGSRLSLGAGESPHNGGQTTSPQSYAGEGLLIPTDRDLEELEEKWLPSLGRLRVEKEVSLSGYALYALRTWVLSRTQWSQSIVTPTNKASESITAYLLVPEHGLSHSEGKRELHIATQILAAETKSQVRRTDVGMLLVSAPIAWGQDASHIPGGDLRLARPFLVLNTNLRRLGCGGKSFNSIGAPPASTLRRKFLELYQLQAPPSPPGGTWSENTLVASGAEANGSPARSTPNTPTHILSGGIQSHPVLTDPFVLMVQSLVKLIQASLYIWGLYANPAGSFPIDGFFCDETKAGVVEWRKIMGFERDPSLNLDSQSSGSCIDTRTLAALLSSITSTRYQLAALDVDKVPKDPFVHPMRFLSALRNYQISTGKYSRRTEFLSVAAIRALSQDFAADRSKGGGDTLNLHKLVSGVTSATSTVTSTLKGGEDAPLRKREYLGSGRQLHSRSSGLDLILPDSEVGLRAAPNIITCNLIAYKEGIIKSKERDWDVMGARRIAALYNWGEVEDGGRRRSGVFPHLLKRRTPSRDRLDAPDEEGESSTGPGGLGTARHTLREVREKTGQVIRDGIGFVSRRGTIYYETSDSESGKQRVPRRRQQTVPTVIEPEIDEEHEMLIDRATVSPTPSNINRRPPMMQNASRASHLTTASRASTRPSIITQFSNDGSEHAPRLHRDYADAHRASRGSARDRPVTPDDMWPDEAGLSRRQRQMSRDERALAWHDRGYDVGLLRTASDGADVTSEEGGLEWVVRNPHGTGKGQHHDMEIHAQEPKVAPIRRHSMEDMKYYRHMTLHDSDHLTVDVDLCAAIVELRHRKKVLAKKEQQLHMLANSIEKGDDGVKDVINARNQALKKIDEDGQNIERHLRNVLEELPDDEGLDNTRRNMNFYLGEEFKDMDNSLRSLKMFWDEARAEVAKTLEEAKRKGGSNLENRRKENGH